MFIGNVNDTNKNRNPLTKIMLAETDMVIVQLHTNYNM